MAEQILWSVMVKAERGPTVSASGRFEVDAYDKLSVTVTAGSTQVVELGPGTAGSIRCIVINPGAPDGQLSYDVAGTAVPLDEPQFLLGGAVGLAGNPTSLTFTNGTATDAEIEILVGRDSTP